MRLVQKLLHFSEKFSIAIDGSSSDGRERGFEICEEAEGRYEAGRKCVGSDCRVTITESCAGTGRLVGTFHTHPSGNLMPSLGDVMSIKMDRLEFGCIGGVVNGRVKKVRCMTMNRDHSEFLDLDGWLNHAIAELALWQIEGLEKRLPSSVREWDETIFPKYVRNRVLELEEFKV